MCRVSQAWNECPLDVRLRATSVVVRMSARPKGGGVSVGDRLTRWPVCQSRSNASRATDHIQGGPQVAEQLDPVRCESERICQTLRRGGCVAFRIGEPSTGRTLIPTRTNSETCPGAFCVQALRWARC